jgi:hypothetical protein
MAATTPAWLNSHPDSRAATPWGVRLEKNCILESGTNVLIRATPFGGKKGTSNGAKMIVGGLGRPAKRQDKTWFIDHYFEGH